MHRAAADGAPAPQTVEGILERFVYVNDDETFHVAVVRPDAGAPIRAAGALGGLAEGERVRLLGQAVRHPKHGDQFRVEAAYPVTPATAEGIRAYLASGRVKGIGAGLAERLVDAFGAETLEVIESDAERLATVPGIGPKRGRELQGVFQAQKSQRDALVFLQGLGVTPGVAGRIWRRYGANAVTRVRENPYRLAEEVAGVGFATADNIARSLGFAPGSPERVGAALAHLLGRAGDDGHCFLPRDVLLQRAADLLGAGAAAEAVLDGLLLEGRLIDDDGVYLRAVYGLEREAAARVQLLAQTPVAPLTADVEAFERVSGLTLAPAQRAAVERAAEATMMVLTGGPGTGKTTIVRALLHLLKQAGGPVLLAAPTGRAARRMAEATGQDAKTLHRLLEYNPAEGGFRRDEDEPLEATAVVVDEASMVDLQLFVALLRAVPAGTRLLLVGDADQLPSVGAGNVLADLLRSDAVPAVRLTEIFRQAQTSHIVVNAHRVLQGEQPLPPPDGAQSDFYLVRARDPDEARELIAQMVADRIPKAFGLDSVDDVQVLTPMHRGGCGAERLNEALQERLNPKGAPIDRGKRRFRVGDKVMQLKNDYEKEVFNGDLGRVKGRTEKGLLVDFDGRFCSYAGEDLEHLTLAYACSVHKSQGSEYPAVVLPLLTEHWVMLQRNLLYTALTRARRLMVLVAEPRALRRAVQNVDGLRRFTGLARRLAE